MVRSFATSAKPSHHNDHRQNHKFLEPNSFLGSWQAPKDPKEAEAKLAMLRRDYAKQVKEVRKQYIREMELLLIEKQRKDEARREALRVANEERKKLKAEAAQIRAQERKIAQQQFRETLVCFLISPNFVFLDPFFVSVSCLHVCANSFCSLSCAHQVLDGLLLCLCDAYQRFDNSSQ